MQAENRQRLNHEKLQQINPEKKSLEPIKSYDTQHMAFI